MFAVIKAGGKQYRVVAEDVIRIDRQVGEPGDVIEFGEVLLVGGDNPQVGAPTVSGATVAGVVLNHERGDKVIAFKKRRRKNSSEAITLCPGFISSSYSTCSATSRARLRRDIVLAIHLSHATLGLRPPKKWK